LPNDGFVEGLDNWTLTRCDFHKRFVLAEPGTAIDFRKFLHASGLRRPFHLEGIADKGAGIALAFGGPRSHRLAGSHLVRAQGNKGALRDASRLLGELAPGGR
jgi:hypothetical protein